MTIWLITLLLLPSIAAIGYQQGAIRAGISFIGIILGVMLAALAEFPAMRGIRMQMHWHQDPLYRFASESDLMHRETFRKNFARLAEHNLSFDLQVFSSQMADAAKLRRLFQKQH